MSPRFAAWKTALVIIALLIGGVYALPNVFGEQPALEVARKGEVPMPPSERTVRLMDETLRNAGIQPLDSFRDNDKAYFLFANTTSQQLARTLLIDTYGREHDVSYNLLAKTPAWLQALGAAPMRLGLDLRGGVYFLLAVDLESLLRLSLEKIEDSTRSLLSAERINARMIAIETYNSPSLAEQTLPALQLVVVPDNIADAARVRAAIESTHQALTVTTDSDGRLIARMDDEALLAMRDFAVKQNLTTLRNRVNELGIAEPLIQRQGDSRLVVQLAGVQDTLRAREILGATATLEFRAVEEGDAQAVANSGRAPVGSVLYYDRFGSPVLLKNRVIVTGDQLIDASTSFDDRGQVVVSVTLDDTGGRAMLAHTKENVGNGMATVFIESKQVPQPDGTTVREQVRTVINVATIRDQFANRFQISGIDSVARAHDLALLLRAGALAAPLDIIEERTIGPSLGRDNIEKGVISMIIGTALVVLLMIVRYRLFGLLANVALVMNVLLLVALLSLLQATLTLPGIAGIILTVGMAVDANVLIFERIREERRRREASGEPQVEHVVDNGFNGAFSTIFDANITTLIAAVVLFALGSGAVRGFAVTLSLGILTSLFTAIWGTRMLIALCYRSPTLRRWLQ